MGRRDLERGESERVGKMWVGGLAYYLAGDRSVECTLTRD